MITLLLNSNLYGPERKGNVHILVGGGQFLHVGDEIPAIGKGAGADEIVHTIDLEGKRVFPGFIDCHAHITGGGGEAGYGSRIPPLEVSSFTSAGVTSVVGLLGTDDLTQGTGSLVSSAYGLRASGLSAWCLTGGYHYPPTTLTGSIRSDIVYVDPIIGMGELAISDHRSSQVTMDELLRCASEAHVAGVMTGKAGILHLHLGDGDRGLQMVRDAINTSEIPARVFNPTHVNRRKALFEEACALTQIGSSIDVTAFPVEEGEDAWTAAEAVERYLKAGLPPSRITVSSDGGGCLPVFDDEGAVARMEVGSSNSLLAEASALFETDLEIQDWLPAFTSNVAELLRLSLKGRVVPGYDADLLVMDENGSVTDVMALGQWHVRDREIKIRGLFE